VLEPTSSALVVSAMISPPRKDFGMKIANMIINGCQLSMIRDGGFSAVCGSDLGVALRCPEDWRRARREPAW